MVGESKISKGIMVIVLTVGAIIMLIPFFWMGVTSFKESSDIIARPLGVIPHPFTLKNFAQVIEEIPLITYYLNSLMVTGIVILFALLFSSMAGYAFGKLKFPGKNILFFLVLATVMIPPGLTVVPLFLEVKTLGLADTRIALTLPSLASVFAIFIVRQHMESIPNELIDAAKIDGCSQFKIFWSIILPLSKPILAVTVIFLFFLQWNDFLWPLVVISSESKKTISLAISSSGYLESTDKFWWGQLMSLCIFIITPVIIVFLFLQRYIVSLLMRTGLK